MDLEKIIEEIYSSPSGNYPASSESPRKDFVPLSKSDNYNYPYQRGDTAGNLTQPSPDSSTSYPWPLQNIENDLSDAFVFIATAMSKISQSVKNNQSLDDDKKQKSILFYKKLKYALDKIKFVGLNIGSSLNLSEPQPDQNPVQSPEKIKDESLPQSHILKIKLP